MGEENEREKGGGDPHPLSLPSLFSFVAVVEGMGARIGNGEVW